MDEHWIYPSNLANLYETGVSPNSDALGKIWAKQVLIVRKPGTRNNAVQRVSFFKHVCGFTMLPTVVVNGDCGRPLFITKGGTIPWREVVKNNCVKIETVFDYLPRGSLATTLEKLAGVDVFSFQAWAVQFVQDVADKTSDVGKVLLNYDGYRSHLGYKAIETLKAGNILAYCLPAHTSCVTQPLDDGIFGPFKVYLNEAIHRAAEI